MSDKHLSTQFDSDLTQLSAQVMEMGGIVESQLRQAINSVLQFDAEMGNQVLELEKQVNQAEVDIDRGISSIISRRQPTARDLRLLIAVSKTTTNLERAGDEASKIARRVKNMQSAGVARPKIALQLKTEAELALELLRSALNSLARLDVDLALDILKRDDAIDAELDSFTRALVTYMMEDPRTISASLDLLTIAKSLERVGDHAKNIAEFVIYVVKGLDIRHSSIDTVQTMVR
jgi:phosphate transport system protein